MRRIRDRTVDHPVELIFLSSEDQRDHRAEPGLSVGLSRKVFEQQRYVVGRISAIPGITGRTNPRRAAERIDFQTGIVGETVQPGAVVQVAGLLKSISLQSRLLFRYILGNTQIARRYQLITTAENLLRFGQLMTVIGSKNNFHSF